MSRGKILFQLSGSIACFKACQLLSQLVKAGFEVEVVATRSALQFVGEATLEGLSGRKVHVETFATGEYMNHIHLARWADLILLCPATANTLNKLAAGVGDDLLSTLFLAHDFKKPYLVATAMNASMPQHPATQASIEKLESWGVEFLGSGTGRLACGEVGEGRLLEPNDLFARIEERFAPVTKPLSVLITSGGTREPIDGVRSITNSSSGRTGSAIADAFSRRGHQVTFLGSKFSVQPSEPTEASLAFESFSDLEAALTNQLKENKFDAVVHAAAVSDYRVAEIQTSHGTATVNGIGKIESSDELTLKLVRTPKLIDQLRSIARNKKIAIVAFKLTNTLDNTAREKAVEKLQHQAAPDILVHNDLHEIEENTHRATIFSGLLKRPAVTMTKSELARELEFLITKQKEVTP